VSPEAKDLFALREKCEVGKGLYDFIFTTEKPVMFTPGQYMEWTLAHKKNDSRGNRRYFTIASSPTEPDLRLGVKFPDRPSSFKKEMLAMRPGDTMIGGQLAGDFTMPRDPKTKLAFLAGGIGITPFRSMIKFLVDHYEKRDVVLLYSNRSADEIAYREVFDEAAKTIGLKTVYSITDTHQVPSTTNQEPRGDQDRSSCFENRDSIHYGRIDADLIRLEIPDFSERILFISGTNVMVADLARTLRELDIPGRNIKTDFFPGF
jgi:ferredoxin-NADP reductase